MKKESGIEGSENSDASQQEILIDPHGDLFPDQTVVADENILSESYKRLQLIYALGQSICGTTDLENLLIKVVGTLVRSIRMERCFVAAMEKGCSLKPLITHRIELSENQIDWPVSNTIIYRALEEGLSILCTNALEDFRFGDAKSISAQNIRSVMCVPMGPKGSPTGLIYADNRMLSDTFSEVDLHFLTALSHYIDLAIRNARELAELKSRQIISNERCAILQQELFREHKIVGRSRSLLRSYEDLKRAAEKNVEILLLGETGTGKELFAKAVHKLSRRSHEICMPLNISEKSESLIESELFGHEKGAFTGAIRAKMGILETANGGTLFLDEVAEIPSHIQAKLLRVIETGEFMRAGGTKWIRTDVRLVCATNRDLETLVKEQHFREDLYYRLNGVTISIPPLRERTEDIPELVEYAMKRIPSDKAFSKSAIERLQNYSWPGNVRELMKLVEGLDALCESETIEIGDLPAKFSMMPDDAKRREFPPLKDVLAEAEKDHLRRAMEICRGDNNKAIKLLGIARATFFERKKRYRL